MIASHQRQADDNAALAAAKRDVAVGAPPAPAAVADPALPQRDASAAPVPSVDPSAAALPRRTLPIQKRPVLINIPGAGSAALLETMMGKVVRDASVHNRSKVLETRHAYYLRSLSHTKQHVDHVCECQFMGHAIVQAPSFARGGGASLLAAVDVRYAHDEGHFGLGTQGAAIQNAVRPLYNIQVWL